MLSLLLDLKSVLLILVLVNLATLFIFRQDFRFVKGQLIIFGILMTSFLVYRSFIYPATEKKIEEEKAIQVKKFGWQYLGEPDIDAGFTKRKEQNRLISMLLFRITGIQAAFSFVFAMIGFFITSDKKIYGLYALGFFGVAFFFFS